MGWIIGLTNRSPESRTEDRRHGRYNRRCCASNSNARRHEIDFGRAQSAKIRKIMQLLSRKEK
jgi:hypothetical protein